MKKLKMIKKTFFMGLIMVLVLPLAAKGHPFGSDTQKKKITCIDQLPRRTYKISGTIIEMIKDDKAFAAFARLVRQDIENQLNTYDIRDKATLSEYYGTLLTLDLLDSNQDAVLNGVQRMRELVDKPASQLMTALIEEVIILARQKPKITGNQYKEAFARILEEKVKKYPWDTIQESIVRLKGAMDMYSENLLLGLIQSTIEPALERSGYISSDMAQQVIGIRFVLKEVLPLREQIITVYGNLIKTNRIEKPDIWKERDIDLTGEKELSPVVVAIWDTGLDTTLFPGQLFTNPKEKLDGKDNDANGFVDDIHGIAYTLEAEKTTGLLYPMEGKSRSITDDKNRIEFLRGFIDMQNAVDSPEAAVLKKKMSAMQPGEVKPFLENLMQLLIHMHGTHVGGIAIAGNPYARILTVRSTFDYRMIPKPMTMEIAHRNANMYKGVVAYLKANGARVVNMSWSYSLKELERNLEANGIGKDAKERGKMARQMFDVLKKGFYEAIKNAPEILFVNSAGNEDNDPLFQECIPASFDLPNVMVVGAVDQAGDETAFTSFGEVVDVYANGYNVESFLPGGQKMPSSGTSMSSPQVANLAAKLLAISPQLKIPEVVELIIKGADKSENGRILLINPNRSVQLLKSKKR